MHERVNISSKCTPVFICSKLTVGVLNLWTNQEFVGDENWISNSQKGLAVLSILTFKL